MSATSFWRTRARAAVHHPRVHPYWMRLRRPARSRFVDRHLDAMRGIEIGGSAHNDFGLDVLNVDRYPEDATRFKQAERRYSGGKARAVDVVASAEELPFDDDSTDFVFASHVIEHCPDPIRALFEFHRVARHMIVLVVPHRDRSEQDRDKPLTSIEEQLERYRTRWTTDRSIHWSHWTLESFIEMCDRIGLPVLDALDPDDKVGNGFMVALDASGPRPAPLGAPVDSSA